MPPNDPAPRGVSPHEDSSGVSPREDSLEALALDEIEEAAGELHRRIATALRAIGEPRADSPDDNGLAPRREVASLAATLELAGLVLAAVAAGGPAVVPRIDRHPALVAAVMYAAPSIPALLGRLDQDRRLVASIARTLESRLGEEHETPWGKVRLRRLLVEVLLGAGARCAIALEDGGGEAPA
ncbi:MAG: hypothetical protein OXC56_06525 [Chloroflexi bacterium]|nr:hypothetical protein [Chloroflexota bacterium]